MSKDQKRLGRGLSSLIAPGIVCETTATATAQQPKAVLEGFRGLSSVNRLMVIPVESIRTNPSQPRRSFDEAGLASLAASIRDRGAIQPIVVRPAGAGYELVAGERRLRAAKLAGVPELPAIVRSTGDNEMLELALIENIQREDLNAVERARGYRAMEESLGLTHEEIARRMGEDRATVTNYIRILGLPEQVLASVSAGSINMGQARALLGCEDQRVLLSLADKIAAGGWSVRRVEKEVAAAKAGTDGGAPRQVRPAVKDLEDRMSAVLGAHVHIKEGRRRHTGRIIIDYGSLDDFQRIAARLGVDDDGP